MADHHHEHPALQELLATLDDIHEKSTEHLRLAIPHMALAAGTVITDRSLTYDQRFERLNELVRIAQAHQTLAGDLIAALMHRAAFRPEGYAPADTVWVLEAPTPSALRAVPGNEGWFRGYYGHVSFEKNLEDAVWWRTKAAAEGFVDKPPRLTWTAVPIRVADIKGFDPAKVEG